MIARWWQARAAHTRLGLILLAWYGFYRLIKPGPRPLFPETRHFMAWIEHQPFYGQPEHHNGLWADTFGELVFPFFYVAATLVVVVFYKLRQT
jgi:hypothetical protein